MRTVTVQLRLTILLAAITLVAAAGPAGAQARRGRAKPAALPCGSVLAFQVLLDRAGFSPGEIDGRRGSNLTHAISAFQEARELPARGRPDCATWKALGGESDAATQTYSITEGDVSGPFVESIPPGLPDQAKLPALGYTSALEQLAEKFHASPALLRQLNPELQLTAGEQITVPAVEPFEASPTKPAPDPAAAGATVQITRDESAVRVTRADGTLLFFAPVTTGSEHDPLPIGDWKVTGVSWNPAFNYNPDLFWDAKPSDAKATLKPGPNNPVGMVWIDISKEHYGLHGTPSPSKVGHAESHGCVRLTNWDAARLAALVKPGTPVKFK